MDMVTDPRLQQFSFDAASFPFPHQQTTSDHSGQYDGGLQYAIPIHQRGQEQDWAGNGLVHNVHSNPGIATGGAQSRLRNVRSGQPSPLNGARQSPTPGQAQRNNGIVFKNSSSTFPQGTAGSAQLTGDNGNIYLPLTQSSTNNVNYFGPIASPQLPDNALDPTLDASLPDPDMTATGEPSANPFSDGFPLMMTPPNLAVWRHHLFNIIQPLHLTEAQFLTYFPHVDNVYSHRSTQKYKRKPFISHYWDCRLKGRPSGTKKSEDPNKKKRKREKRERDLCDVKIKITEWFGENQCRELGLDMEYPTLSGVAGDELQHVMGNGDAIGGFGTLEPAKRFPKGHPGATGKKWYTVQRVNGTSHTNGAGDDVMLNDNLAGAADAADEQDLDHKHTLEESDRIKKNTVQRYLLKEEKDKRFSTKKRPNDASTNTSPSTTSSTLAQLYRATGLAYSTATSHSAPAQLTFFGNSYCPFGQRIWIALEVKGIPYQYVECVPPDLRDISGSAKNPGLPKELLEVNPEGNIPCIRHGNWAVWESHVMMEYLEELEGSTGGQSFGSNVKIIPLLPPRGMAQLRAHCRLWVDHVERKILPAFYAVLLMPPTAPSSDNTTDSVQSELNRKHTENRALLMAALQRAIAALVNASHATGPFFLGETISYVDVAFAPWIIRLSRVLERYRGWSSHEMGVRWQSWVNAVEGDERVRRTVCKDEGYHSVYQSVGEEGYESSEWVKDRKKSMLEMNYARMVIRREGFGLGGDLYGRLGVDEPPSRGEQ